MKKNYSNKMSPVKYTIQCRQAEFIHGSCTKHSIAFDRGAVHTPLQTANNHVCVRFTDSLRSNLAKCMILYPVYLYLKDKQS